MATILTAAQILQADDIKKVLVFVPDWNGSVYVRGATARERDEYEQSLVYTKVKDDKTEVVENSDNARARFVVKCVVDESGNRLFTDDQADALGKKSAAMVNLLFQKIQSMSAMGKKAMDELEKKSAAGPTPISGTSSPDTSEATPSPTGNV